MSHPSPSERKGFSAPEATRLVSLDTRTEPVVSVVVALWIVAIVAVVIALISSSSRSTSTVNTPARLSAGATERGGSVATGATGERSAEAEPEPEGASERRGAERSDRSKRKREAVLSAGWREVAVSLHAMEGMSHE